VEVDFDFDRLVTAPASHSLYTLYFSLCTFYHIQVDLYSEAIAKMPGAYVPPHLRNRTAASTSSQSTSHSSPSTSSSVSATQPSSNRTRQQSTDRASSSTASKSRTPWSRATTASTSRDRSQQSDPWPVYDRQESAAGRPNGNNLNVSRTPSGSGQARQPVASSSSPTLYVFGDSFVGPMKLLSNDCARKQTYKGASAKVSFMTLIRRS
jgi:hypothetical protein